MVSDPERPRQILLLTDGEVSNEAEVIDLLTISPLDDEQFTASVRKTGHVVIVHEACRSFGPGAEIMARLVEKAFFYPEAPLQRVTGFDVPFPYFAREQAYVPDVARILHGARQALRADSMVSQI